MVEEGETIESLILFVFLIGSNYFFSGKSKKRKKEKKNPPMAAQESIPE